MGVPCCGLEKVGSIHGMVDTGIQWRVVEGLEAGDVGELFLEEVVEPVHRELPLGGEDV